MREEGGHQIVFFSVHKLKVFSLLHGTEETVNVDTKKIIRVFDIVRSNCHHNDD